MNLNDVYKAISQLSPSGLSLYMLIPYGLIGFLLCYFGYTLRRVYPVVAGLLFGAVLGFVVKICVTYHQNSLAAQIDELVFRVGYFRNNPDILVDNILYGANPGWIVVPWVLAMLFAMFGAKFYRAVAALSVSLPSGIIVYNLCLTVNSNQSQALIYSVLIAVALFVIAFLAYNALFIVSCALSGAAILTALAMVYANISNMNYVLYLCGALFLAGCVVQGILLHKHNVRVREA